MAWLLPAEEEVEPERLGDEVRDFGAPLRALGERLAEASQQLGRTLEVRGERVLERSGVAGARPQFFVFYNSNQNGQFVNAPFYFSNAVKQQVLPPLPPSRNWKFIDPCRIHQTQKYFTFLVNTNYMNKRIAPQVLYLLDMEEQAHGLKAKINFNFTSYWRPEIGFIAWWGEHDTGKSFGLFEKNRQVYAKIKYQF